MDNFTNLTAFIGGIAGFISLAIIIYKTYTEKPILKFKLKDAYFWGYDTPENPMTSFSVSLTVSNKGQRSTTIHTVTFSFEYKGKTYMPTLQAMTPTQIPPDDTKSLLFSFYMKPEEGQFSGTIEKGKLIIEHTHNKLIVEVVKMREAK